MREDKKPSEEYYVNAWREGEDSGNTRLRVARQHVGVHMIHTYSWVYTHTYQYIHICIYIINRLNKN